MTKGVLPRSSPINSEAYWDQRFEEDWDARGGRKQSRAFMELLVRHLPAAVYEDIVTEKLSLLDCGCAKGDGTAFLAAEFPGSRVGGFDFSDNAVENARASHPGIDFFAADFEGFDRAADILVASHCLEHLTRPVAALRRLTAHARRSVVVLVPFLESFPPHAEHVRVVHASTFPESLDGWRLTHRINLPPTAAWDGNQLLLVYQPESAAAGAGPLTPLPSAVELDQQRRLRLMEGAMAGLAESGGTFGAGLGSLTSEIESLRLRLEEIVAQRSAEEAALREQLAQAARDSAARQERAHQLEEELRKGHLYVESIKQERDATVRDLSDRLAAAEREREGLVSDAESWRWDATTARRELARLQGSRLWRVANLYWRLRRRLGLERRKPVPARTESAAAAPTESPEVANPSEAAVPPGLPSVPASRYDVVVFSIIDWDFRFQRPQQLATQFGRQGHRVFYLSTTQFLPADGPPWAVAWKAKGVVELRLRSRRPVDLYGGRLEEEDLAVLEEAFADLLENLALGDVVGLVQIPFWAPLAARLRERYGWRVVYDCMDEWTNFPGFGEPVLSLEEGLVREADLTVASALRLQEKLDARAARLVLARNGVDLDHYRKHFGANDLLGEVRHPVIGYYGALASWVDAELLEKVARRFPDATIVLAGGVFDVDLSAVEALPNVRLLGQRPYEEMPRLLWHFDACIIPFLVNDITEATNPVKFYEYVSAGKPVVAPRLTELLPFEDLCYLAESHDQFLDGIASALAEPADDPRRERRRAVAAANDWRERYATIHEAVVETFPLVSVIVVTYGGLPLTRRCLESLLVGETWPRLEVIVVDNASPDGTPEHLRAVAERDPRVRLLLQERNLGFPAGNNAGLQEAHGDIVLLLNNDTVVPPGMIGRLVRPLLRDLGLGVVVATTNFCGNEARVEPGYEDVSGLPLFAASRARRHAGRVFDLDVAAMYCVAARREIFTEVGPLDEAFGIGMFEDDDYSLRVRQAGYRVVCVEDAYVHHIGQGSFQTLSSQEYDALWQRNQAHYEKKWARRWKPHTLRPGVAPVMTKVGQA
jgi:GT2 family glycosyltransferase